MRKPRTGLVVAGAIGSMVVWAVLVFVGTSESTTVSPRA